MNCTICGTRIYSMTVLIGKSRTGVSLYKYCPVDDRIFKMTLHHTKIDGKEVMFPRLLL